MFTHVVMFKLKEKADCAETITKLRNLESKVPSLRSIEVGQDLLQKGRSFDIVLITKFDDLAGMEAYQVDPHHVTVVEHMHRVAETAVSVDYED